MEVWNVPFSADPGQPQKSLDLVVRMSVQCQKYGAGQGRAGGRPACGGARMLHQAFGPFGGRPVR